jgi:hypothetical protein
MHGLREDWYTNIPSRKSDQVSGPCFGKMHGKTEPMLTNFAQLQQIYLKLKDAGWLGMKQYWKKSKHSTINTYKKWISAEEWPSQLFGEEITTIESFLRERKLLIHIRNDYFVGVLEDMETSQ